MLIAVVGAIGSGKSFYLKTLSEEGHFTVSTDEINRELMANADYIAGLAKLFPACIENGTLSKQKLKETIFSDPTARAKLEAYSHPKIMARIASVVKGQDAYVEVTAPTKDILKKFDYVILVDAPIEVRRQRVTARDGISAELFDKINSAQMCHVELKKYANEIVYTA